MEFLNLFLIFLVLVIGIVLGSVANAVIYRLPKGISWTKGKSICTKCKHRLSWPDLIPVVSYVLLGGRCRYCRRPIGLRYLLVELIMGAGFVSIYDLQFTIFNEFSMIKFIILIAIFWVTVVIAVMDFETRLVSELMVAVWGGLGILLNLANFTNVTNISNILSNIFGGVVVGIVIIGGVWALTRGKGMGFGDVEIAVVMGVWLGWPKIGVALWIAFVSGAMFGLVLLSLRKSKLKSEIAFGTFLVLGSWIAYLFGENITRLISLGW